MENKQFLFGTSVGFLVASLGAALLLLGSIGWAMILVGICIALVTILTHGRSPQPALVLAEVEPYTNKPHSQY